MKLLALLGRIRVRLLAVNLLVVLVPLLGLELARVYERQLLHGLERDMLNQATLVRVLLEADIEPGQPLDGTHEALLERAATRTRTRIRLIDTDRRVVADSHRFGPPEGPEIDAPLLARGELWSLRDTRELTGPSGMEAPIPERREVKTALGGSRDTATRFASDPPAVFLFLAEPIRHEGKVVGVVYVTRSTQPVLFEMHRVRAGLIRIFALAFALTALISLALAFSISRPLEKLARAARRITQGDFAVEVPRGGGGEISELGREFEQMTRRLEHRQRYISQFAADVAHEFKSPLTSIRGAAELLTDGADDDPDARRRFLDNIKLDATRLDRLVSRLLELSRIDAAEQAPTLVDLRAIVARAVTRSERPDAPIAVSYEATVSFVLAREQDIETALLNVLDNAQRFSPEGKAVRVFVRQADAAALSIRVEDDGPGILPEHRSRIFERFFTTDAERDGTGLGLAIVKSVLLAHGGSVSAESEVGVGTAIELRLPIGARAKRPGSRP